MRLLIVGLSGIIRGWSRLLLLGAIALPLLAPSSATAEFVKFVDEAFTGETTPGWTFYKGDQGVGPLLTGDGDIDPVGDGWLRLTNDGGNEANFVYNNTEIPTKWGIAVEFDFVTWSKNSSLGDGFALVLFDAGVTPSAGGYGGSLGYAQRFGIGGLAGGVVGIGFDEFGNFSDDGEGRVDGPGRTPNSIAIRGSMGADRSLGYEYVTGTKDLGRFAKNSQGTMGRPDGTNETENWVHSVRITIDTSREMTIQWTEPDSTEWVTLIDRYPCTLDCPEFVKIGFTSGTGGSTAYHEIRNLEVRNAQAIPEPGSISLALGVGLVALVLWRRRRAATGA